MPELPEVETTCQGISPHLSGKKITSIDIRNGRLRWPVSDEIYHLKNISLAQEGCVTRRAKYILIALPLEQRIIIHLGMSGSLRICSQDEELKKHDHVIFHLSSGLQMRYHDPRRFGCVLWTDEPIAKHPLFIKLGPEPLTKAFSAQYLVDRSKLRKKTIKQHIMDNHIVVGVGNIYACEALFAAGIHPQRQAGKTSKTRLNKLRVTIREVLQRSIDQGGTTLKDFIQSDGQPGYFKQQLNVYDREGQPCRECETLIKRVILGQRSTFYCPKCQK
jgi:formamidopyrimidine-DNA glycosylase